MKRKYILSALLSFCTLIFLCSCGSPEDTVEDFYEALYNGDFEEAQKYCSEDAARALDHLVDLAKKSPDAVKQWREDMANEKRYFRLLNSEELAYLKSKEEEEEAANKKKEQERRKNLSKEEFKKLKEEEQEEQDALKDAKIVYTRWSKGIVYKHYVKKIDGQWKIIKIESAQTLPDRFTKGN